MHPVVLTSILVAVLATGCQSSRAEEAPARTPAKTSAKPPPTMPPSKPPPTPPSKPPLRTSYDTMRFHMHQNFDLLRAIERLLIRGQLDDAKRFAIAIATAPDAPAHGPWAAHVVLVRDRAAALGRATTVDEACARETSLAAACAGCHVELGVAQEFKQYPPAPPDKATVEARMLRHRWAADRLWEGLVGGTEEPWRAALDVLAAPPLEWATFAPGRVEQAEKLRRLADQARNNKRLDLAGRATASGEMLATCAACHTAPTSKRP